MGNRYGRNQRRRHREEAADLQQRLAAADQRADRNLDALHLEQKLTREIRYRYDALAEVVRHWDREIRRLLGPYTAAAMTDAAYQAGPGGTQQMAILPPLSPVGRFDADLPEMLSYHVERIISVIYGLTDADRLDLSRHMFMRLEGGDGRSMGRAHFGMSAAFWDRLARDIRDGYPAEQIARKIVPDMVKCLAEAVGVEKERRRA